ncbi:YicC/YloC family endoribonuclease [candidate division CSSED10-310 bacterium]|uniref:YicC/YloC family endoribonuclease n=1 Tax=candidate division CSSED10-310 bacterium TaxID=2855610 RepID=A0ABV6YV43_UNCC1
MKSMTGFGRGLSHSQGISLETTLRSVNHRYCLIKIKIPPELYALENMIRTIALENIARGTVEISMKLEYPQSEVSRLKLDHVLAREYVYHLQKLSSKVDMPGLTMDNAVRLDSLLNLDALWSLETPDLPVDDVKSLLTTSLKEALKSVNLMRQTEGEKLKGIIQELLTEVKKIVAEVEALASHQFDTIRERLQTRIQEKLLDNPINEKRLEEEILYYCEKSDITEEIDRLKTHLQAAFDMCLEDDPVGRKVEFLIQEMFREANTLGVKAASTDISSKVVLLKTLLDKLKEQVQNIE